MTARSTDTSQEIQVQTKTKGELCPSCINLIVVHAVRGMKQDHTHVEFKTRSKREMIYLNSVVPV